MEAVIVALIGVVGSILVVLVEKGRKENSRDHGIVASKLEVIRHAIEDIDSDVAHIESKLDDHLNDHANSFFSKGSNKIERKLGGFDIDDIKFKTGEKVKEPSKSNKKVKKHGSKKR